MLTSRTSRPKRIAIIGDSCSGKTTLAQTLGKNLGLKHVELDSLFWEPNWKEAELDVFKNRIQEALAGNSWVVDGNFGKVRDVIWDRAELVVWLDFPLSKILARFFMRSLKRSLKREVLWNGCRENLKNSIFQKNSLLMWILKSNSRKRIEYSQLIRSNAYPSIDFRHLKSDADVRAFIHSLANG